MCCSHCGYDNTPEEEERLEDIENGKINFQPMSEQELKDISARAGRAITTEEEAQEFLKQERENLMREHQFDPQQKKRDEDKLKRRAQ